MAYEKVTLEDVANIGTPEENKAFMDKYNKLVDELNDDITRLNSLLDTYGIKSVLDTCGFDKATQENFTASYDALYRHHSMVYEQHMGMQEDIILSNSREFVKELNEGR